MRGTPAPRCDGAPNRIWGRLRTCKGAVRNLLQKVPLALWRVLGRQQDRPAPLAAEAEALQKPQDYQQDRRGDPYGSVSRQQVYQHPGLCAGPVETEV